MDIIVGTHRSGTSLVARILATAGADFGSCVDFHPADKWNPDGYFERRDVLRLNRRMIEGGFGKFANVFLPGRRTLERRARRLGAELRETAAIINNLVVKDPRFNVTGPGWEAHGVEIRRMIVCFRDPLEVADSLRRRNRLPLVLGVRSWASFLDRLLENYGNREWWVVDFERLTRTETAMAEASGLIRHCGLEFEPTRDEIWLKKIIRTKLGGPVRQGSFGGRTAEILAELRSRHGLNGPRLPELAPRPSHLNSVLSPLSEKPRQR